MVIESIYVYWTELERLIFACSQLKWCIWNIWKGQEIQKS